MEFGMSDVSQGYGARDVLTNVTFALEEGITALLGPNGAGKSTLMRTLVTEMPPKSGEIFLNGDVVRGRRQRYEARTHIGYLPQEFGFDGRFTVREYVEYLSWLRGVPSASRKAATREAISLAGLDAHVNSRMRTLSGGTRQRAGIAGAIVGSPALLVLDEPTVGLDPSQRAAFRRIVSDLPAERVLLSTHLTDDVEVVGEHLLLLNDGRMLASRPVQQFTDEYGTVERGYLHEVGDQSQ